jgi:hypothetical protein
MPQSPFAQPGRSHGALETAWKNRCSQPLDESQLNPGCSHAIFDSRWTADCDQMSIANPSHRSGGTPLVAAAMFEAVIADLCLVGCPAIALLDRSPKTGQ